jgi:hypothetical protein
LGCDCFEAFANFSYRQSIIGPELQNFQRWRNNSTTTQH